MHPLWRIELLGRLRVEQSEREITRFRTHKTGALLAYLAYFHHGPHPRDELIELLWPELEPNAGRNSLSKAVSSLRHQLEPADVAPGSVLIADRCSIGLKAAACSIDVA